MWQSILSPRDTGEACDSVGWFTEDRNRLETRDNKINLNQSGRSDRLASGSASGQDFPRFFITGFFGNRHGSRYRDS